MKISCDAEISQIIQQALMVEFADKVIYAKEVHRISEGKVVVDGVLYPMDQEAQRVFAIALALREAG